MGPKVGVKTIKLDTALPVKHDPAAKYQPVRCKLVAYDSKGQMIEGAEEQHESRGAAERAKRAFKWFWKEQQGQDVARVAIEEV